MISPFQAAGAAADRPARLRRSCLSVPGSSPRMMAKAAGTPADEVMLDLEDGVAPDGKEAARALVVEALHANDYRGKVVCVRVNGSDTALQYADVVDVVSGAGARIDGLVLPKVEHPGQLWFAEHLLSQLELELGLGRRIGVEAQIESGAGSARISEVAQVTDRLEALVFGPGDYAADLGVPQLDIGAADAAYPGHQWHYALSRIVTTARAVGRDAIDGPYSDFADADGFRESCRRARMLGVDGKWCIHPAQIALANEAFTPSAAEFEAAERLLAAYADAVAEGRGAATLDGKMIDEASRKMAERVAARGRAAGL